MPGLPFDVSSAVRIAVLRETSILQRAVMAAALGLPLRIGGIAGAASAWPPNRAEPNNNTER